MRQVSSAKGQRVEKRQPAKLTFTQPSGVSQTNNPNTFNGTIAPAFAGAPVRVVYTPEDPQNPNGTITHNLTTDGQGVWQDQVNFQYSTLFNNPGYNEWVAQAFFEGDEGHTSAQSNVVRFSVGD